MNATPHAPQVSAPRRHAPGSRATDRLQRACRGSSLIEVLMSLLVLSVGLLGMAALHGRALQYGVDAEDRNRAALLASEIVSSMWLNQSTVLSPTTVDTWQARVRDPATSGLPNASAAVSAADVDGVVTVTVNWRPNHRSAADGDFRYVTQVVLP